MPHLERNCMNGKKFVDTNIMVYAYDLDAGSKRDVALERINDLWHHQRKTSTMAKSLRAFS